MHQYQSNMELDSLMKDFLTNGTIYSTRAVDLRFFNWSMPNVTLNNMTFEKVLDDLEKKLKYSISPVDSESFAESNHWDDLSFMEKEQYLHNVYGPKHRFGKHVAIGMTIFFATLFAIGTGGNLMTILIISMNSYMKQSPNYYLFNLAVVDIITLWIGKHKLRIKE